MPPRKRNPIKSAAAASKATTGQKVSTGPPAPLPILETDYVNTPPPNQHGNWTRRSAGGHTFMTRKVLGTLGRTFTTR